MWQNKISQLGQTDEKKFLSWPRNSFGFADLFLFSFEKPKQIDGYYVEHNKASVLNLDQVVKR